MLCVPGRVPVPVPVKQTQVHLENHWTGILLILSSFSSQITSDSRHE